MTAEQIKKKEDHLFWYFIAICCFVLVFVVGAYFIAIAATQKKPDGPGEFGDLFGVCTCLFSGLAFAGLLYTVNIQKLELRITRDELIETAKANRATAEANLKSFEIQKLSTIIAGRQAILDILTGPNRTAQKLVWDKDSYPTEDHMIKAYSLQVKNALNTLDTIQVEVEKQN